ncbi:protein kinase [bacterium]|nr:protein kinase [bacterium]
MVAPVPSHSGDDLTKVLKPGEAKPSVRKIGDFELVRILGEGGMGSVYLARDPALERQVAIKVVRREIANNEQFLARFMREAKICASLNHPNIVSTYSVGTHDGAPYLVLELVEGHTLKELLQTPPPLSLERALEILAQCCEGLEVAARRRIVHRDIKPANIMVRTDGLVKIMDFGLSREVHTGNHSMTSAILGTPDYMAPEQAAGRDVDFRGDLYALGITLFQCVAGYLPFRSGSPFETIRMHAEEPLPDDSRLAAVADGRLLVLIQRLTAKDPADRPSSHREVRAELLAIRESLAGSGLSVLPAGNAGAGRLEWQRPSSQEIHVPGDTSRSLRRDPTTNTPQTLPLPRSSQSTRKPRRWGLIVGGTVLLLALATTGVWVIGGFDDLLSRPRPAKPATQATPAATQAAPRTPPPSARPGITDGPFSLETTRGNLLTMQDLLGALGNKGMNNLVTNPRPFAEARGIASFDRRQLEDVLAVAVLANGWKVEHVNDLYRIAPQNIPPATRLAASRAAVAKGSLPLVSLNTYSDSQFTVRQVLAALKRDQGIDYLVIGSSLPEATVPSLSLSRQPISTLMEAIGGVAPFTWTWERGTLVMVETP